MVLGRRSTTPFEKRLGHRFRQVGLMELALTHRSYANEQGGEAHYERLEFLGDAVLGLITTEWLYRNLPDLPEGDLTKRKNHLVSKDVLAPYAERLALGELLRLGVGEERSGGRGKTSLLANSMEAVFGAVYLDGGIEAARSVIVPMLEGGSVERPAEAIDRDAKTRLQEVAQGRGWALPEYRLAGETGPDHSKVFLVECWLQGESVGQGEGSSKKIAEQRAAADALSRLR
ncbi:MAG TPA: ribonuclease III [Thermoanaerobaculia bacterium]|nr:ribonuclease III [Thermoanaerobaculia bacterium]